jgi:hypothetical protein
MTNSELRALYTGSQLRAAIAQAQAAQPIDALSKEIMSVAKDGKVYTFTAILKGAESGVTIDTMSMVEGDVRLLQAAHQEPAVARGVSELETVVQSLCVWGKFQDDAGEATNALSDLLEQLKSVPQVPPPDHRDAPQAAYDTGDVYENAVSTLAAIREAVK